MKSTLWSIILSLCFLHIGHAQVSGGETTSHATIGNWESFYVYNSAEARARMTTTSLSSPTAMAIDAYLPNCELNIEWIFSYQTPLNNDTQALKIPIFLRVDSGPMHVVSGFYKGVMGDSFGIISLNITSEFQMLLQEMGRGAVARIRFETEDGSPLETDIFSLNGFVASMSRIQQGCRDLGAALRSNPKPPPPSPRAPRGTTIPNLQPL